MNVFDDPEEIFSVLVNDEHQHSLWPARMQAPDGWRVAYPNGSREECLAYVERNWTDIRPLSAR
jgi:MbtH protein